MAYIAPILPTIASAPDRHFVRFLGLPVVALDWLVQRMELARSRRELLSLDDRMLADIGLDRASARAEGEKGFWG